MNRKEWIEYFEVINNRKPTIQECQQALQNGEFVMEGRQATFSNNGNSVPAGATPLPNQVTGQMVNQTSAQQLVFVKQKKFGKKTFIGLGIALFLVLATSLGVFLFSFKETNLNGLWVTSYNAGLVYELSGKKSKLVAGHREEEIKEISTGQKVRQKFETSLEDVSDSKLKTIADFDKKYQLQTKEIILVKTDVFGYYNLIQKDGTNLVLDLFLSDLYYGSRSTKDLKKIYLFHKVAVPKVFVGKWKKFDSDDDSEGEGTISENGVVTTDSDGKDILIAKPLKEYMVDQSGSVDNDEVQKEFAKIQKSLKSHGYQAKSVNDIYHDARKSYCYVVVDGGKRIIILEGFNHLSYTGYLEREDK
ncbi:hypothetical protein [Streptococcus raffinosi]|uniref:Uncharacterized protein n=1 Tax=Streptococcus raffinosi TaxID=3053355 RepID=A0ABT7LRS6_9STRE|nr:hypothetical protein [Streptococcus sp. VTCC 12813]MDL5043355.1 hypothetical protein [Streptococcus sp. VTCC 12812]MDM0094607.1 hypothetical protein [Streptococcus sp. VTCC 12813]